jgi:starch-binding outer membrane protein, SusD/RagB family
MKTKFNKIIAILLISLIAVACSDDFFDNKPVVSSDPASFYTDVESIDLAVTAVYSYLRVEKTWDLAIHMVMGSVASDEAEAGAGGPGDVTQFQHVDELSHVAAEPQVFPLAYGYLLRAITAANTALENIPNVVLTGNAQEQADQIATLNKRKGEVLFLRALNYFYLTIMFGGVPLVDHTLSASEYNMPRAEISDVLALVKSDLTAAISLLPTKSEWGGAENLGRASKGAAMALLAKTYLYESSWAKNYTGDKRFPNLNQHWDSVVYWGKQVIAQPEYALVGLNGERFSTWRDADPNTPSTTGYQFMFMVQGNNSSEGVFEIQCRNDGLGAYVSRGQAFTSWCAPRQITLPNGSATDFGWGWWCPTDFLVNSYEPGDPRKDQTVLDITDTVLHVTHGWVHPNFDQLMINSNLNKNSHKYEAGPSEVEVGPSNWPDGPNNIKVIRIADVYLWVAEADFELGNITDALPYINAVRQRARNSGNDPSVLPDLTSATLTHAAIEHERLCELACEGHRFYDLVRWKLANQYLDHTLARGYPVEFREGVNEFFPIPEAEIILAGGALVQYDGY